MYDKLLGKQHLNKLLKHYGITVSRWTKSSCGSAHWRSKKVAIPDPYNADRFAVCMHEIKHIMDGDKGMRFEQEFDCDMFAREQMILIGCSDKEIKEWDRRVNWHSLSRIAMAVNRGLNVDKIRPDIKQWFSFVDFEQWRGKKVFISYNKTLELGYTMTLTNVVTQNGKRVTTKVLLDILKPMGYIMFKSEAGDSTYNKWVVRKLGEKHGSTHNNLMEVVDVYKLTV